VAPKARTQKRRQLRVGLSAFDYPIALSASVARSMRANRSKNTSPELIVRAILRRLGFPGYRLHWPIAGRPDIVFPARRIAIFVHGCFWHACERCNRSSPKNNAEFWSAKFALTLIRDHNTKNQLEAHRWRVVVVRECELDNAKALRHTARRLKKILELAARRSRLGPRKNRQRSSGLGRW